MASRLLFPEICFFIWCFYKPSSLRFHSVLNFLVSYWKIQKQMQTKTFVTTHNILL